MLPTPSCFVVEQCLACHASPPVAAMGPLDGCLCRRCFGEVPERPLVLPTVPSAIASGWFLGSLGGPVGRMVRAGTTGGNEAILWALARHCALRLGGLRADRVAAVPVSPWRRLPAGLNPADLLAHTFAAHRGLPLFHPLARRRSAPVGSRPGGPVRGRVPLAGSAFRRVCPVEGRVLLVTDALTTGSTARACAEELLRAGASAVDLLAIAADPCGMAREC